MSVKRVRRIAGLPEGTSILEGMASVDYLDSYVALTPDASIGEITEKVFALPWWVLFALRVRHVLIAKPFGLTTGRFDSAEATGTGSEPVPVITRCANEIVMGSDDKHLYYRISVMKESLGEETRVFLSTAVRFHNVWGRLYFLPVQVGHRLVVRSLLKKLA
jgi:hypothetical protein